MISKSSLQDLHWENDAYIIRSDDSYIDIELCHRTLKTMYWAKTRDKSLFVTGLENSLNFGIYTKKTNAQVGFTRVVTDFGTLAWLCDMFVLPEHREQGLAHWLLECIYSVDSLNDIFTWLLGTKDQQSLYKKFDFEDCPFADVLLSKRKADL